MNCGSWVCCGRTGMVRFIAQSCPKAFIGHPGGCASSRVNRFLASRWKRAEMTMRMTIYKHVPVAEFATRLICSGVPAAMR